MTQEYLFIAFIVGIADLLSLHNILFNSNHSSNLFQLHFKSFSVTLTAIFKGFSNIKLRFSVENEDFHSISLFFPSLGGSKKSIFIFILY